MSKRKILAGSSGVSLPLFVQDTSQTNGAGLGSLVYNSTGLAAKYRRQGDATWTAITLVTATVGTWTSGGFISDGGPVVGTYEVGIPNAALIAGATWVEIAYYGAANMLAVVIEIELDAVNYQDAVAFGLTMVPGDVRRTLGTAVTLDANSVLNVSTKYLAGTGLTGRDIGASVLLSAGTGAGQLAFTSGVVSSNSTQWLGGAIPAVNVTGVPLIDAKYLLGTVLATPATAGIIDVNLKNIANAAVSTTTAQLGINVVNYNNQTAQTDINNLPKVDVEDIRGTLSAGVAGYVGPDWSHVNAPTTTVGLSGTTISTGQGIASVSGSVGSVTGAVGSVTGNIGGIAGVAIPTTIASPTNITAGTIATVTNLTNAPTAGDLTSAMKTSVTTAATAATPTAAAVSGNLGGNVVGSVGSVTAGVTVTTNNDKTGYALTQSFPANFGALGIGSGGHILNVDTLTTYTSNTPQSGDSFSITNSGSYGNSQLLSVIQNVQSITAATPTAIQNRQEMDANSTKLANLDVTVSSRLTSSAYVSPPSASTIAVATAAVMFVDGSTNPLKVNTDHSVNLSGGGSGGTIVLQNYVTVPPSVAVGSQIPNVIICLRGDTLRVSLPPMGNLTSRTKLVFTAKACVNDSDDLAVLLVIEGIGLTRMNGDVAVISDTASLAVIDDTTGAVNLELDASVTALLAVRDLVWDAQAFLSSGISSPIGGIVGVVADVTQAVT